MVKNIVLISAATLLLAGCAAKKDKFTKEQLALIPLPQRTNLPQPTGGFVIAAGGETITSDEIILHPVTQNDGRVLPLSEALKHAAQRTNLEHFKQSARPQLESVLNSKLTNALLYKMAKDQAGENIDDMIKKFIDDEINKFIAAFNGDYAKAEQALKDDGLTWQSFKDLQKKKLLSQSYISSKLPQIKPITYSELMDFYNQMKDGFVKEGKIKFRLIDIQPARLQLADPNKNPLEEAKKLAEKLASDLKKGADFGQIAEKYSHDHRASFGGLWNEVNPQSLAKPYDIIATACEKIRPGQIEGPIEVPDHIFIVRLEEKQDKITRSFEDVQPQLRERIELRQHRQAIDEFSAQLVQKAKLTNKDEFIDFCLERIYLLAQL